MRLPILRFLAPLAMAGAVVFAPAARAQRVLVVRDQTLQISPLVDLLHTRTGASDIDRDGYLDFVVTGLAPETLQPRSYVYQFERELEVTVGGATEYVALFARRASPIPALWGDLVAADVNGDRMPDIVSVGVADTSATAEPATLTGTVGQLGGLSVSNGMPPLAVSNGRVTATLPYLASSGRTASGEAQLTVVRRTGGAGYTLVGTWPGVQLGAMDFGDCDGDGDDDLVLTGVDANFGPATFLARNDGGAFTVTCLNDVPGRIGGELRLVDIDGDGDDDLILTGSLYGPTGLEAQTTVRRAEGCTFALDQTPPELRYQRVTSVVVADLQASGQPRLILSVETGETRAQLFEYSVPFSATSTPTRVLPSVLGARITVGDFNADTIDDLLVTGHRLETRPDGTSAPIPVAYLLRGATYVDLG